MSIEDEISLQKFRNMRGYAEQYRLVNNRLATEIKNLKKRHEMDSSDSAQLTQKLEQLHQSIYNCERWRDWLDSALKLAAHSPADIHQLSRTCLRRPDLEMGCKQPAFSNERKKAQWQSALNRMVKPPPRSSSRRTTNNTSESSFLLARAGANSPPSSRRSSLMLLLNSGAVQADSNSHNNHGDATSQSKLKPPLRVATRTMINATLIRNGQPRKESVERYKKTAAEQSKVDLAKLAKDNQKEEQLQCQESAVDDESDSSLELEKDVIEMSLKENERVYSKTVIELSPTLDQLPKNTTTESNNAVEVEKTKSPSASTDESIADIYVAPSDVSLRSILRRSIGKDKNSSPVDSALPDTPSSIDATALNVASLNNLVRFHPLALLLDAALEGDVELVKKVAYEVEDVSEPNDEGITALHNAVCAGRLEIAEFLVKEVKADVNAGDTDGWTPLHCAASCANLPLAKLLVEHGAALNARTLSDQETPMEKCDHLVQEDADCEEYLDEEYNKLGTYSDGRVFAVFDRNGSHPCESPIRSDELEFRANDELKVIDKSPEGEADWMLAEHVFTGKKGLVPKTFLSCYPLLKVPKQWHERVNWDQFNGFEIAIEPLESNNNRPETDKD
ncbi:hypothetical protein Ciccas_011177 [Cichlidogyrus casuarinus]|uniref:SH3 domain-containing protein n=1 Tax=Cichlidogyrus casuarinus TaxID=1844966 RepID=A0ABD2PS09_9PLAT